MPRHVHASSSSRPRTQYLLRHLPPTTALYTLSLTTLFRSQGRLGSHGRLSHARLSRAHAHAHAGFAGGARVCFALRFQGDRKSTRLNSSHVEISYAVFCSKKKTVVLSRPRARYSTDWSPAT